jgi:hypothetical protein
MSDDGFSYLDGLEKRLHDIETSLARVHQIQGATVIDVSTPPEDSAREGHNGRARHGSVSSRASNAVVYPNVVGIGEAEGELDTAEDSIDGMGAIKFTDEEDWGYFGKSISGGRLSMDVAPNPGPGPSSNIAFLRHISLAMARMGDLSQSMPSPSNRAQDVAGGMSVSRPHPVEDDNNAGRGGRLPGSVNIYALPSEARTWSLIQEYFQKTGQLLPFVHEETFCATFFTMKRSNFTMARRTWLGLLNIILAMATTLHIDRTISSEKRIEESDVYYQRAIGLCDKESRRNISLELGV